MKDVERFDLFKLPDSMIIKELKKIVKVHEVEKGKLNAYILELETKIKKQEKLFKHEMLTMQNKHAKELRECQESNEKISNEERKELKKELIHNKILSGLKTENTKLTRQIKQLRESNEQLCMVIARLRNVSS